jgi:uncharacterized protein (TIGR03435 family)
MLPRNLFVLLACSSAFSQTPPPSRPQFEAASVKPNTGSGRGVSIGSPSPGRFRAENVWLRFLIQTAWNVKDFQVSGGPSWAASERYDIDATTDGKVPFAQMRLMLQTLLEERFQLVLHQESKDLPVYELAIAKSGMKLQAPKEGGCVTRAPDAPPQPPVPGQPPPNYCGATSWSPRSLDGSAISMQTLTTLLANILQHPVIDKTGFAGTFDVHLAWTADQSTPGLMAPDLPQPALPSGDAPGPTIFTVIAEQLGLKLLPGKAPTEVLVIDRAEKPTGN